MGKKAKVDTTVIKIDGMRDILIIEKSDGGNIFKGSNVYCGCCGKTIGIIKNDLKFPFQAEQFLDNLENKTVKNLLMGLRHEACGHTMFLFKKSFEFMTLENYNKQFNQKT